MGETETCLTLSPCQSKGRQGEILSRPPSVIARSKATKQFRQVHRLAAHPSGARNDERFRQRREALLGRSIFCYN